MKILARLLIQLDSYIAKEANVILLKELTQNE